MILKKISFGICVFNGALNAMFGNGFGFLIFCVSLASLWYFRNPPPNVENAEQVLQSHKTAIIAHRGGAIDAPENTLAAIRQAKKNGADGVEIDLEFTADYVPILLHDDTLDRTTNGTGPIKDMVFEEVKSLSASAKHPFREDFPNEQVPTLEDAVVLCLELGLKIYIDVKGNGEMAVAAILKMYQKYPQLYSNAIVCSFWPSIVYKVRRADPNIVGGLTFRSYHNVYSSKGELYEENKSCLTYAKNVVCDYLMGWSLKNWLWYFVGSSAYLAHMGDISNAEVKYYKERGISVIVWTPNQPYEKEYIEKYLGCSYVTDTMKTETFEFVN